MNNINLGSLSFEQLTALKAEINTAWNNQYEAAIQEVTSQKQPNGDFLYTYGKDTYLASKLSNGKIRIFQAETSSKGYRKGEVVKSEFPFGFGEVRRVIRFNQFNQA